MSTICVYGAAREDIAPNFIKETEELGRLIGSHGYKLIYGAGASGLMGAVARGMTAVGGYIIGVTPHFISKQELASKRAHTVYDRLVAAGNRLMRVIEQNKGGTNKELGRFTDQIINLCEKYQR